VHGAVHLDRVHVRGAEHGGRDAEDARARAEIEHAAVRPAVRVSPVADRREAQLRGLVEARAEAGARLDEDGGAEVVAARGSGFPGRPHGAEARHLDRGERLAPVGGGRGRVPHAEHAAARHLGERDRGGPGRGLVVEPAGECGGAGVAHPVAVGGRLRGVDHQRRGDEPRGGGRGGVHGPLGDPREAGVAEALPEPLHEAVAIEGSGVRRHEQRVEVQIEHPGGELGGSGGLERRVVHAATMIDRGSGAGKAGPPLPLKLPKAALPAGETVLRSGRRCPTFPPRQGADTTSKPNRVPHSGSPIA
jgi:hypothetical protein